MPEVIENENAQTAETLSEENIPTGIDTSNVFDEDAWTTKRPETNESIQTQEPIKEEPKPAATVVPTSVTEPVTTTSKEPDALDEDVFIKTKWE
jgi:hypothetical protein